MCFFGGCSTHGGYPRCKPNMVCWKKTPCSLMMFFLKSHWCRIVSCRVEIHGNGGFWWCVYLRVQFTEGKMIWRPQFQPFTPSRSRKQFFLHIIGSWYIRYIQKRGMQFSTGEKIFAIMPQHGYESWWFHGWTTGFHDGSVFHEGMWNTNTSISLYMFIIYKHIIPHSRTSGAY